MTNDLIWFFIIFKQSYFFQNNSYNFGFIWESSQDILIEFQIVSTLNATKESTQTIDFHKGSCFTVLIWCFWSIFGYKKQKKKERVSKKLSLQRPEGDYSVIGADILHKVTWLIHKVKS